MYSLTEEETIKRIKNSVYIPFVMIRKSVMISNMAISDEKSTAENLLSLLGHLGILTNTGVAVNSNKNSRTVTKPTRTAARTVARGFSNGNIQNTIKGASHSVMET
jgi:hypothetical protein